MDSISTAYNSKRSIPVFDHNWELEKRPNLNHTYKDLPHIFVLVIDDVGHIKRNFRMTWNIFFLLTAYGIVYICARHFYRFLRFVCRIHFVCVEKDIYRIIFEFQFHCLPLRFSHLTASYHPGYHFKSVHSRVINWEMDMFLYKLCLISVRLFSHYIFAFKSGIFALCVSACMCVCVCLLVGI